MPLPEAALRELAEKNVYESGKFLNPSCRLILSHSLENRMFRRLRAGQRKR